jgi:hypothetical protein
MIKMIWNNIKQHFGFIEYFLKWKKINDKQHNFQFLLGSVTNKVSFLVLFSFF